MKKNDGKCGSLKFFLFAFLNNNNSNNCEKHARPADCLFTS